jgi:hypothetical protein
VVQVDAFWSYAIGAGCGAAAAREQAGALLADRRFAATVLYLSCLFAPSGVWLLWQFTSWETMHTAQTPDDLPGWLVAGFALTNVTQGVLGYAAARALWRRGHRYLAWLQMPLGYLAMFFVLAYGWDGTGYRRFFAATPAWRDAPLDVAGFLSSDVALTLYGMGGILVPLLVVMQASWWRGGHPGDSRRPGLARMAALVLVAVFGLGLGLAAAAAALLTLLGPILGSAAVALLLAGALHPRGPAGTLARATYRTEAARTGDTPRRTVAPDQGIR